MLPATPVQQEHVENGELPTIRESQPCVSDSERVRASRIRPKAGEISDADDTGATAGDPYPLRGWAINVLNEAGAIGECEDHGWMQDRADPHARERAFDIARVDPPPWGLAAVGKPSQSQKCWISIGDTCPECPPPD